MIVKLCRLIFNQLQLGTVWRHCFMRWWRRVTTARYGQLCRCGVSAWVAARWQCSNKKQLPTHQRRSLLARNSEHEVQCSVACACLWEKRPGCCAPLLGQGGSQGRRSPCLHSPHHRHRPRRGGALSLSISLIIDLTSCASCPLRAGHSGSWARPLLT